VLLHSGGFEMAASQNRFCSPKLSLHKKITIFKAMIKNVGFLITERSFLSYIRAVAKQDQYITHLLHYANIVL
jgi:hypothetical protein